MKNEQWLQRTLTCVQTGELFQRMTSLPWPRFLFLVVEWECWVLSWWAPHAFPLYITIFSVIQWIQSLFYCGSLLQEVHYDGVCLLLTEPEKRDESGTSCTDLGDYMFGLRKHGGILAWKNTFWIVYVLKCMFKKKKKVTMAAIDFKL